MVVGNNGGRYYCYRDVLPFTALVAIECVTVGGTTLYKAATSHGMNYYVFIVYTFLIGSLLLLPYPFFLHRRSQLPPLKFSVLLKISFLGLVGYIAQIIGYVGINYCSPTLSSAMGNLIPAFTFIIAFIFRVEKLNLRSFASQAKIVGTVASISGALVATLYNGPRILFAPATSDGASTLNWLIGGLLLAGQNLLLSIIYVYQAQIMQEYPVDLIVVLVYDVSGLIVAFLAGLVMARSIEDWKLKFDTVFAAILYMGFTAGFMSGIVHTWALRMKGPLYVAMFKPLSIVIAVVMGVLFLGDTLHLGSVVGGAVISVGFYAVVWGKAKEEKSEDINANLSETSTDQSAPFLQGHGVDSVEDGRANACGWGFKF